MESEDTLKAGVIVLNYNGLEHLKYSLGPIVETRYHNKIVYLTDNASTDGSLEYVRESYPSIEIVALKKNYGWSGGNNRGIKRAIDDGCDIVALANNDIIVDGRWLEGVVMAFNFDPKIMICGSNIFGESAFVDKRIWRESSHNTKNIDYLLTDDHVGGKLFTLRASLIDKIGYIDEGYFIYSEETDFQYRARLAGFKVAKTNVPVWHNASGTMRKFPIKGAFYQLRSRIRYSIKHDDFMYAIRVVASIFKFSVLYSKSMSEKELTKYEERLRPRGRAVNLIIFLVSLVWNVYHLSSTLKTKRHEYNLIESAREHLKNSRT